MSCLTPGWGSCRRWWGRLGSAQVTTALADTYRGPWTYAPGAVFADLAAAVAGEADCERLPPHRSLRLYVIPLYATTRLQVVSGPRHLC
ncbi:MAG: hypothetical protein QOG59_236, partial [Solirubrobacteraceae bacterium]|nr:hypothetical protein [Solirubrobacteraceae bacterium]